VVWVRNLLPAFSGSWIQGTRRALELRSTRRTHFHAVPWVTLPPGPLYLFRRFGHHSQLGNSCERFPWSFPL